MEISLATTCTLIVLLSGGLLIALERMFPYTPGQPLFRGGFLTDLGLYAIVQSYVLGLVIFGFIAWVDEHSGVSRAMVLRSQPLALQMGVMLIIHDFYIYWFHRWQHHSSLLWRIHEAHHSTTEVDWLSGSRSHSLEILVNQTVEFLPIVLLASPEVAVMKGAVDAVWGMYIHSNINVRSGWLQRVINGPEMHRWHHADDPRSHNRNFSTKFAVWDWLFGTAYLPRGEKPTAYGLHDDFPKGYIRQHLYAFRRRS
ncbi:MAG: sterol desaturase family protein [Candidatus Kapabacteria bacterium]|nr:sterol desaturase family protein [Candidatus Kapabacteria bacterium]